MKRGTKAYWKSVHYIPYLKYKDTKNFVYEGSKQNTVLCNIRVVLLHVTSTYTLCHYCKANEKLFSYCKIFWFG